MEIRKLQRSSTNITLSMVKTRRRQRIILKELGVIFGVPVVIREVNHKTEGNRPINNNKTFIERGLRMNIKSIKEGQGNQIRKINPLQEQVMEALLILEVSMRSKVKAIRAGVKIKNNSIIRLLKKRKQKMNFTKSFMKNITILKERILGQQATKTQQTMIKTAISINLKSLVSERNLNLRPIKSMNLKKTAFSIISIVALIRKTFGRVPIGALC